jgi:hypothetical protein
MQKTLDVKKCLPSRSRKNLMCENNADHPPMIHNELEILSQHLIQCSTEGNETNNRCY